MLPPSGPQVPDKDRNKLSVALPVLGERLCAEVLSRKNKSAGLDELRARITSYTGGDPVKPGKLFTGVGQLLVLLLRDPVWATFQAGAGMVLELYSQVVQQHSVSSKTLGEVTIKLFGAILSR